MTRMNLIKTLCTGCAVAVLTLGLAGGSVQQAEAAVSEKSIRFYDKAIGHVQKGDLNAAVIQLKNAIRTDADNVDARFRLATLYLMLGDSASAEKEFKAASARGYDRAQIIPLLAQSYVAQRKFEELLASFEGEMPGGKAGAVLFTYRAQALINLKRFEEAQSALDKARAQVPDMPEVALVGAWLRQAEGDLVGAEALTDEALKGMPDSVEALSQKAELRRMAQASQEAADYATRALEINPTRRAPRVTRGLAQAAQGLVEEVLEDAEVLLERNQGDPAGAFLKAWAWAQKGKVDIALEALTRGQAQGLDSFVPALYLGAALHLRTGSLEQARLQINRYLALVPGHPQALATSSAIHFQAGEYDQARDILEDLYDRDPLNVRVVTMLASVYEKTKERAKAAALFDEAINLVPDDTNLQLRAAQARIVSGDLESGIAALADLSEQAENGERAARLLFVTQLRKKDFVAAQVALDRLEELKGKTAETENFRASIALAEDDYEKAEMFLKSALEKDKTFPAARLNLARLYTSRGDMDAAKSEYETLLKQQPGYMAAFSGLVGIAQKDQDQKEIVRLVDLAVRENPDEERAHGLRVQNLLALGLKDRALVAARGFMASLPEKSSAYDALAQTQIASGDVVSGIVTYRQLVSREAENSAAWMRLAQALVLQENNVEVMFALDRVLSLDPGNERARLQRIQTEQKVRGDKRAVELARTLYLDVADTNVRNLGLGRALVILGEADEGLGLAKRAYEATGNRQALVVLYGLYDKTGRLADLMEVLTVWLAENPDDRDLRLILFSRLISVGRWQPSIEQGEILLKADPKNVVVLNNLAWVYEKVERIEEAVSHAKLAVELAPDVAEIADTYGWILFTHGDAVEAEAVLDKASAMLPARRDIGWHHAAALAKVDKPDAAKAMLLKLLADGAAFDGRDEAAALLAELE